MQNPYIVLKSSKLSWVGYMCISEEPIERVMERKARVKKSKGRCSRQRRKDRMVERAWKDRE